MTDEYQDYFQSDTHIRIFEIIFTETFNEASRMVTETSGGDSAKAPGLLRAISKMQAHAAAVAHFYSTIGMKRQGSEYFRRLADQIEGSASPIHGSAPAPKKPRKRAKSQKRT